MLMIENVEVLGWEHAIRGMRNPLESWDKMDSHACPCYGILDCDCPMVAEGHEPATDCNEIVRKSAFCIGKNDYSLMMRLAKAGGEHAKYRRMIVVYADVTAPLYWWKEFDTYKVGTVANSCSTMHKIHAKQFVLDDFSHEHLTDATVCALRETVDTLNFWRAQYNSADSEARRKECWWQMIQLLPSSYNQKRTVLMNYEVSANIYQQRKNHKLDEWREFCTWIESLPYSELIVGDAL